MASKLQIVEKRGMI